MPSTITIMPAMNTMVDQLMPPEDSDAPYQKVLWPKADRFRVSHMAPPSCIQTPNTSTSISAPQPSVTHWRGMRSSTISRNIMTKITSAASSATIGNRLFLGFYLSSDAYCSTLLRELQPRSTMEVLQNYEFLSLCRFFIIFHILPYPDGRRVGELRGKREGSSRRGVPSCIILHTISLCSIVMEYVFHKNR